ncbi:hypothetical protein A3759_08975 [Thalassolituus sp. HI0120]|nr:hypothetical protein A3759_08975 [Thalassolituus sp. HI0120]
MPDSAEGMEKTSISWFDSHCHFDFRQFDEERIELWQRAQQAGVLGMLIPGITLAQSKRLAGFCRSGWYFAQGIHPYFIGQADRSDLNGLESELRQSNAVAVGEIGIDKRLQQQCEDPEAERKSQWRFFADQVAIAKALELPIILHVRGAHDEVSGYLRQQGFSHGGVVHAFSGSVQQGKRWLDAGFKLGIGGAMTFPRARKLRRTLEQLPSSAWLLETDAPDMSPAFLAGKTNTPEMIPLYGYLLAALRQESTEALSQQLRRNLNAALPAIKF